jgi:hypothetical protein
MLLIVYCAGIAGCVILGALIVQRTLGDGAYLASIGVPAEHAARLRIIIKILGIAAATVGCLSAKFYGCNYSYDHLLGDPVAVTWKVLGQFEGMFRYLLIFLLILVILHLFLTILTSRRRSDTTSS